MKCVVCGAGGFIGNHLVDRLKAEGHEVTGIDQKLPEFSISRADQFFQMDLRYADYLKFYLTGADEVYQLAADMGGAGFVFTGENDAEILRNSTLININVLEVCRARNVKRVFFSSSACIYPEYQQNNPDDCMLKESMAYPAAPDSDYGWEKLLSERLYLAYARNYGMTVRIGRYHNVYGPMGTWQGGREKAPAAVCRKVAMASDGGEIEIWGDGKQTRSFLYIDDCIDATIRLMRSDCADVLNIGTENSVTINELVRYVSLLIAKKHVRIKHVPGPLGVRGRSSDNALIMEKLAWCPQIPLLEGLKYTYDWIAEQVQKQPVDTLHADQNKALTGP